MGAAGGQVDLGGDRDGHREEDHYGDDVLRIADRQGVGGRREVVVQQERADGGRRERGQQSAEQGGDDGEEEEEQDVVGEPGAVLHAGEQQREQDGRGDADQPAGDDPGPAEAGAAGDGQAPALGDVVVGDDVDVQVGSGLAGHGGADAGAEDVLPGLAAAGAEHDLGGVDAAGELQQRGRDVVAYDVVEGAAEVLDEGALYGEFLGRGRGQPVAAGDVDGEDLAAGALGRHARGAADERTALGSAGEAHDDALARLPGGADVVLAAVLLEVLVDTVGDPQERQFAQRGEVAGAEVVGQGGVELVRLVYVAVGHAAAQRLGRHVDQLDLVGAADDLVGYGLPLPYAGYRLDDVAEGLQVLDVDRGDDVDARLEQFLDVLPALGVARSGDVGVGEFVDEGDGGTAFEDRVDVHLGEDRGAVLDRAARDVLQTVQHHFGARPVVVPGEGDHAVGAALDPAVGLGEHGVRLADTRRRAEVYPKLAASHGPIVFQRGAAARRAGSGEATSPECGKTGEGRGSGAY